MGMPFVGLDAVRVRDRLSQHLTPAADTQDGPTSSCPRDDRVCEAAGAEPAQIRDRALGPRKNDQIRALQFAGVLDEAHDHVRLVLQRLEVVVVRDAGQTYDRDLYFSVARTTPPAATFERDGVLVGYPQPLYVGEHAEHRDTGAVFEEA